MLPFTRNSTTLTQPLEEAVGEAEEWSRRETQEIAEEISSTEHIIAAYIGDGYAAASAEAFYWFTRVATPQVRVEAISAESVLYHILAYTREEEKPVVLVFAEEGGENLIARLADAARLTDVKLAILSPPLPPIISGRLSSAAHLEVPSARPSLYQLFAAIQLSYHVARKRALSSKRMERLGKEIGNYKPILSDLINQYSSTIAAVASELAKEGSIVAAYTPTMKPAAHILADIARSTGRRISHKPVSAVLVDIAKGAKPETVILLNTDVEEDVVRELKYKSMMTSRGAPRIIELRVKTDPLTAPVYASIVLEAVRDKLHEDQVAK